MMDDEILAIQHFGKSGWLHQVVIDFPGDNEEPEHEIGSSQDEEETHEVICRIIGRRCGFPFEIMGVEIDSERIEDKLVFSASVIIDFQGRRLAGYAKGTDLLFLLTKACEDAALRIEELWKNHKEMLLTEESQDILVPSSIGVTA